MVVSYEDITLQVSKIKHARFGEMVRHVEDLIDSGDWQDYVTPVGTHFTFRPCEFDYFMLAEDLDPNTIRLAYLHATDVDGLTKKQMRMADITGKGRPPSNGDRRSREEVVADLESAPGGAAQRIRSGGSFVAKRTGEIARDPKRRKAAESGKKVRRTEPSEHRWDVRWHDDREPAQAIVDKLLKDSELARAVYKKLHAADSARRYRHKT